jgi:hypothetical protein
MGMGPEDPPVGTTQIYIKFRRSFGPQLGLNFGDFLSGTLRKANIVGETKVGVRISPGGKISLFYEYDAKNVNYEREYSIPVYGGKTKSSEFGIDEHPVFAVKKTETQQGLVTETTTESDEEVTKTETTSYEFGLGVNAIIVGGEASFGFEYVVNSETQPKPNKPDKKANETPVKPEEKDEE